MSSLSPWANRQRSPYLHVPFSLQFLHISYFSLRMATGGDSFDRLSLAGLESEYVENEFLYTSSAFGFEEGIF